MNTYEFIQLAQKNRHQLILLPCKTRIRIKPAPPVDSILAESFPQFGQELLTILQNSQHLPACPTRDCTGSLLAVPTFDGWENYECLHCGCCAGCERPSQRCVEKPVVKRPEYSRPVLE